MHPTPTVIQDVRGEIVEIRAHFARVIEALRATTREGLCPARHQVLRQLEDYARAGRFPRNRSEQPFLPVFHDPDGPRCAAAHLLALDGPAGQQIAIRFARDHNLTRFHDLPDGEVRDLLERWLDRKGLTFDELAWIQPSYPAGPSFAQTQPLLFLAIGMTSGVAQLAVGYVFALAERRWPERGVRWIALVVAVIASFALIRSGYDAAFTMGGGPFGPGDLQAAQLGLGLVFFLPFHLGVLAWTSRALADPKRGRETLFRSLLPFVWTHVVVCIWVANAMRPVAPLTRI